MLRTYQCYIWQQIQSEKKERKELHVTFLDLANAYGSVPHELLWAAFDFFRVPMSITHLVKAYFGDLQFSFSTQIQHCMATLRGRNNGRMHHFSTGFYYGNGSNH